MRKLFVNLVAIAALLTGFYLSARYFSEPVVTSQPATMGDLVGSIRPDFKLDSNSHGG